MITSKDANRHTIAVIGGSIAGSEAAFLLATHDFKIVVFDQINGIVIISTKYFFLIGKFAFFVIFFLLVLSVS